MPSVSGVAGATRTPTPTKTMLSAITGPLPIGPPVWKVKSAAPARVRSDPDDDGLPGSPPVSPGRGFA